ncbi:MAG: M36 family metallopeptidase, partial [Deltaproteobacteria bacterium]|nr:M36 family metallopeptidase [Deltaproteobacteria bacterium]
MKFIRGIPAFILIFCPLISVAAGWPSDPSVNVPISMAPNVQWIPKLVSDGAGGAIITWWDERADNGDIYAQRIDGHGDVLWTTEGLPISATVGDQRVPEIVSDGVGGAIITWYSYQEDFDESDVYAQRVDSNGKILWTTDGIPISVAIGAQYEPRLVSDRAGGAIIVWEDQRNSSYADIYAQRIDGNGNLLWTRDGIPICTAARSQGQLDLIADDSGGAIVVWTDYRSGVNPDLYAQRIDASGNMFWAMDGVPIATDPGSDYESQLIHDGAGGAIVVWSFYPINVTGAEIYAQRINSDGVALWATNGIPIYAGQYDQGDPKLVSDGLGGAIVVWHDPRSSGWSIFSQRVDGEGHLLWAAGGINISSLQGDQVWPDLMSDGNGGAIIAYREEGEDGGDIYAQRIDSNGTLLWGSSGLPVSRAIGFQDRVQLVSDDKGGAIVVWEDPRNGTDGRDDDIYAQNVNSDGTLGSTSFCDHSPRLPMSFVSDLSEDRSFPSLFHWDTRRRSQSSQGHLIEILERLKKRFGEGIRVSWNTLHQSPRSVFNSSGYLSSPSEDSPSDVAFRFLKQNEDIFGISPKDLSSWEVASEYQTSHNGVVHLTLKQSYQEIPVFQGQIQFHIDPQGRIITLGGEYYPRISVSTTPHISPAEALIEVIQEVTPGIYFEPQIFSESSDSTHRTVFRKGIFQTDAYHSASLVIFPMLKKFRLAWEVRFHRNDRERYYSIVDALTGEILYQTNLVQSTQPQGLVFEEDPDDGSQVLQPFIGDPAASPKGWLYQEDGIYQTLGGNNTCTQEDRDANDVSGYSPSSSEGHFEYAFQNSYETSGGTDVNTDLDAALTNLFYQVNFIHDYYYDLGFDEAAGNFQRDNFERGGLDNDEVSADAQDGWGTGAELLCQDTQGNPILCRDNANFYTPADGYDSTQGKPRMQMYLFDGFRHVDGDFDGKVILHEYTHGVSTRLVGGPSEVLGLFGVQSGAMGEGWSDWFAASLYDDPIIGEYVSGNSSKGIRRYALDRNPLTYG